MNAGGGATQDGEFEGVAAIATEPNTIHKTIKSPKVELRWFINGSCKDGEQHAPLQRRQA
jgi:hypothetical protein